MPFEITSDGHFIIRVKYGVKQLVQLPLSLLNLLFPTSLFQLLPMAFEPAPIFKSLMMTSHKIPPLNK
jgi:hypothetical protein